MPTPEENRQIIENMTKDISEIKEKISHLPTKDSMELANRKLVEEILSNVKKDFVSIETFRPIQKLIYGLTGAVLLMVVNIILSKISN